MPYLLQKHYRDRPRNRILSPLALAAFGLLSLGCVAPSPTSSPSADVSLDRLCPFTGTEITLAAITGDTAELSAAEVNQAIAEIATNRLTNLGLSTVAVFWEASGEIIVQLPPEADIDQVTSLLSRQGELTFRSQKVGNQYQVLVPLLTVRQEILIADDIAALEAIDAEILALFDAPQIRGSDVQTADATRASEGRWEVTVEFTETGAQQFTDITREIAGTGRALGIFMDDELLSAPTVAEFYAETGITGGRAVITGTFSQPEAEAIALQLQSGAFPAPTEIVSVQTVTVDENCEVE